MPESSLIFVVIVAIWAAYLIQHWVRRRESAAAARSMDHFSEDMRVLETRTPGAVTNAHVSPADVGAPARVQSPLVARGGRGASDSQLATADAGSQPTQTTQTSETEAGTMTPAASAPSRPGGPGVPRTVSIGQRRLRAALLLLAVLWVPVSVTLVVMGRLMWVSIPLALLTVVAVLFWLRTEARAERARQAVARSARAGAARVTRTRARRRPVHAPVEPVPVLTSDDTQVIRDPARYADPAQPVVAASVDAPDRAELVAQAVAQALGDAGLEPVVHETFEQPAAAAGSVVAQAGPAAYELVGQERKDEVFDLQAETEAELAALPRPEPAEGTWSPVPVPAPTYTMKAKAEPRLTESGIPADVFETPEFADEVAELDERALFARRAASQ